MMGNRTVMVMVVVVALTACGGCANRPSESARHAGPRAVFSPKSRKQAVLSCTSETWPRGKPLYLLFSLRNGTERPVYVDGRMIWTGPINLSVSVNNGDWQSVYLLSVKPMAPRPQDMVLVPPGLHLGTVFIVAPNGRHNAECLRDPARGRYEFSATYYGESGKNLRGKRLSLESNTVVIHVP